VTPVAIGELIVGHAPLSTASLPFVLSIRLHLLEKRYGSLSGSIGVVEIQGNPPSRFFCPSVITHPPLSGEISPVWICHDPFLPFYAESRADAIIASTLAHLYGSSLIIGQFEHSLRAYGSSPLSKPLPLPLHTIVPLQGGGKRLPTPSIAGSQQA
jgi:hypothetical protein